MKEVTQLGAEMDLEMVPVSLVLSVPTLIEGCCAFLQEVTRGGNTLTMPGKPGALEGYLDFVLL